MFYAENLKNGQVYNVFDATRDTVGNTWFLIFANGWEWRKANEFVPTSLPLFSVEPYLEEE